MRAICDYVHDRIAFNYQNADPTRSAFRGHEDQTGVCRDFAHLAITLCRCMNIPARYCTGYLGDIGVPPDPAPDGLLRLVRGPARRPLVHVRRAPQRAAHRPHPDGARARRDRRRDLDELWTVRSWSVSRCLRTRSAPSRAYPPLQSAGGPPICQLSVLQRCTKFQCGCGPHLPDVGPIPRQRRPAVATRPISRKLMKRPTFPCWSPFATGFGQRRNPCRR